MWLCRLSYRDCWEQRAKAFIRDCRLGHPKPSTVGNLAVSQVPLGDRAQAAAYVAALTRELAGLMRRHHLDTLGYLLDVVHLEAEETVQRSATDPTPSPQLPVTRAR